LAWVIPSPTLELHRFVSEFTYELGAAGGRILWWYPIGNPRSVDPIYLELRSPELAARDEQEALEYDAACRQAGSEDHYLRGQYSHRALIHDVPLADRPLAIIKSDPPVGTPALIRFDRQLFESAVWRGALAEAICHELRESKIMRLRRQGVFTADSMASLQLGLNGLSGKLRYALKEANPSLLLPPRAQPVPASRLLNPEECAHANYRARSDGSLIFQVKLASGPTRKVVFEKQSGRLTHQLRLMTMLCNVWPKHVTFQQALEAVYGEDAVVRARNGSDDIGQLAGKLRALLSDIGKKLQKHEIPAAVLPSESPFQTKPKGIWLRLASLNGRKSPAEYDALA
jgi:hypothetical protein